MSEGANLGAPLILHAAANHHNFFQIKTFFEYDVTLASFWFNFPKWLCSYVGKASSLSSKMGKQVIMWGLFSKSLLHVSIVFSSPSKCCDFAEGVCRLVYVCLKRNKSLSNFQRDNRVQIMEVCEEEPKVETVEEKITWACSWKHPEDENDPKSVMLILGQAAGANNDLFEIYADDDFIIQENSPLKSHELLRVEGTSPRVYRKELELTKAAYQFLFVIENIESKLSARVSGDYQHTKLVSGRIVNYIELDGNFENEGHGKDGKNFLALTDYCVYVVHRDFHKTKERPEMGHT